MTNYVWAENEGGQYEYIYWPMCSMRGCENRICIGLSDKYCYPHSPSGKTFDEIMAECNKPAKPVSAPDMQSVYQKVQNFQVKFQ